jgi:hypothetical protein
LKFGKNAVQAIAYAEKRIKRLERLVMARVKKKFDENERPVTLQDIDDWIAAAVIAEI